MPGARMRWMVTMKLSPVRIEEKPAIKMPSAAGMTLVCEEVGAVRRVKCPAGIDAADQNGPRA